MNPPSLKSYMTLIRRVSTKLRAVNIWFSKK